jgi:hypothetical protein
MVALLALFLKVLISPLKPTSRLEAEKLRRDNNWSCYGASAWPDYLHEWRSLALRSALSNVSVGFQCDDDHPFRNCRALASG